MQVETEGHDGGANAVLATVVSFALLYIAFVVFNNLFQAWGTLPEEAYRSSVIVWQSLKASGWTILALVALFLAMLFRSRFRLTQWSELEPRQLRWITTIIAGFLAWNYAMLDRNAFYGSWHAVDRIALVALVPLIAFRPQAVFLFLLVLIPFMNQFAYPNALMYMWPEKLLSVHLLVLVAAYLFLFNVKRRAWPFSLVFLTLVAAHYWPSGWAKLRMNWLMQDELANMIFSAYTNGWLTWWEPDTLPSVHAWMQRFDFPMRLYTLVIEIAAIVFLWNRKLAIVLASSWVLLHLGIVVTSAICFLHWIVIDICIIVWLVKMPSEEARKIFNLKNLLLSAVLIYGGSRLPAIQVFDYTVETRIPTSTFAWFNTRVCYSYELQGTDVSGDVHVIAPSTLAPYDFAFTWNLFERLYPKKQLPIRYGNSREPYTARLVRSVEDAEALFQLEQKHGVIFYDEESVQTYRRFIERFFHQINQQPNKKIPWWLQRPPELISLQTQKTWHKNAQIKSIQVYRRTTLFDGADFTEIRKEQLMRISIPN